MPRNYLGELLAAAWQGMPTPGIGNEPEGKYLKGLTRDGFGPGVIPTLSQPTNQQGSTKFT